MKAVWKDTILAVSADTVVVDGAHYFPPESLESKHLEASTTRTT